MDDEKGNGAPCHVHSVRGVAYVIVWRWSLEARGSPKR
jgi:hypothetical protein